MDANIESIVNHLERVSVEKVTFEAITNSIQASATEIAVYFYEKNKSIDEDEQGYFTVDELKIVDNGKGFDKQNIDSFKTYRSTYKKEFGAKGIGRFLYLKLFDDVTISSLSKNIRFTAQKDVEVQLSDIYYDNTTVVLSIPKQGGYQVSKIEYKKLVKEHFLPYFKLLAQENKIVTIKVFFNNIEEYSIESREIPNFELDDFIVKEHKFTLHYIINYENINNYDGYYCADNRVVIKNSQLEPKKRFNCFHGVNILFLLSSNYFDQNVNDERNNFNIKPIQSNSDMYSNLSWSDIHLELSGKLKEVCLKKGIDVDKEARDNLNKSIEEAPFLANYFPLENNTVLSFTALIDEAKKQYESDKSFLRDSENEIDPKYPVKLNRVVQTELAEYIFEREKIINKLKNLVDDEKIEEEVHNLFMPRYTSSDSYLDYRSNNLWLFDDRFMTYDKVFSEVNIKKAFPELAEIEDRLDLCIISNTYNKEAITDIVIIELKRPHKTITPEGAEAQLLRYARYINDSRQDNKIRIWTYAFLKFNYDIEEALKDKTYNYIPTHSQYPIYYRYYERANIIINFMDYLALADDAHTRNQTFINILKGKSI
jgi:hypothetical protein